jgi:hypothetical protein
VASGAAISICKHWQISPIATPIATPASTFRLREQQKSTNKKQGNGEEQILIGQRH